MGLMTVGWILEGDRDRFLFARDLTPAPTVASPFFQCPFCMTRFQQREQLNSHVQLSHVVKRPFLLIGGAEPGTEDVLRLGLDLVSVETFNCTDLSAGFDGEPVRSVSVSTLTRRLAKTRRAKVHLRLLNTGDGQTLPVVQEYHLRLVAPDETSLTKADELFLANLGTDGVDLDRIGSFYEATRGGAAAEYAEALADYVRAVLLKDGDPRTGVSTRLHHYHDIQNRALNVLQVFERPLAKLLCALIRFGLNDFSRWSEATGFNQLDHAYSLLGPIAEESKGSSEGVTFSIARSNAQVFVCPVDVGTDAVTRLAKQAAELARWGAAAEEQFSALAEQGSLDSFDRAKIRALWAAAALRLGARTSAERALRLLDGDPTFGPWAGSQLVVG